MFTKLTKDQLKKKTEYINSYIGAINAASGSEFDPNANVTSKNVATLNPDIFKDFNEYKQTLLGFGGHKLLR